MTYTPCKLTFSNPRLAAEFPDWPSGGKQVRCVFRLHRDRRGYRFSRTTTGKSKFTTYGGQGCIVDGSDGRTYLLQLPAQPGFVSVRRSDFLDASMEMGRSAAVFEREDGTLHAELLKLIVDGGSLLMWVEGGE